MLAIAAIDFSVSNYYSQRKNFIDLIFVGWYPRRNFFTGEISASYGMYVCIYAHTCISYNTGESALPDKCARQPMASTYSYIRQSMSACLCYNYVATIISVTLSTL